jgi:MoxR-like ATPases
MAKKIKVSVIKVSGGLSNIPIGSKITFEQDPSKYQYDSFAIKALVDDKEVGSVSASPNTTVTGCVLNKELHPLLSNGTMEGTVVSHGQVTFRGNSGTRTALVVEIEIQTVRASTNGGGNSMKYTCKVKGSTRTYQGKLDILADFQAGKSTFVTLTKEDETIIAHYNNKTAGIVDEKKATDTTDFNKVIEVVGVMGSITAKVTNAGSSVYTIEFDIDEKALNDAKSGRKVVSLDEVKNNIVAQDICSNEELQEIEDFLIFTGHSRKQIIGVFSTYRKYDAQYQGRIPKKPETVFKNYDGFNAVKKAVIYMLKGKFLRFVGEKGTGKNNLITTLAWIFQRPLYEVSLNRDFDKLDMVGSKTLSVEGGYIEIGEPIISEKGLIGWLKSLNSIIRDTANTFLKKNTKITFDKEALIEAMEVGAIINYDEVNTADPALLVMLHSITDSRRSIEVAGYGRVVAQPNFSIILTMNKDYQGTVSLNEATRDRFTPVVFPSRTSILDLLQAKFPYVDQEDLSLCDKLYQGMLGHVTEGELSMDCITVRGFIDALDVIDDLDLKEALDDNVANRIEDEEYKQKVLNMIDDLAN